MNQAPFNIEIQSFSKEIEAFLDGAVLGSPGGIRYQVYRLDSMQHGQENTFYLSVYRRSTLVGVVGLVKRYSVKQRPWVYIRYLFIPNGRSKQGKNHVARRSSNNPHRNASRNSLLERMIRDEITQWIIDFQKVEHSNNGDYEDTVNHDEVSWPHTWAYAFVESKNQQSLNLCNRFGFETQQLAETIVFHRFKPKQSAKIKKLGREKLKVLKPKLEHFYESFAAFHTKGLEIQGTHWVYLENGVEKAYLRTMRHRWDIEELPGYVRLLKKLKLHQAPFVKDMIPSDNFEFLSFDYLWCGPGYEANIQEIMEHALSVEGLHTGLSWWSVRSSFYQRLKRIISWGILNRIQGPVPLKIMGQAYGKQSSKGSFPEDAVFINAHDMT